MEGTLSPDGKWLAYTSDETGDEQVYVQAVGGALALHTGGRPAGAKMLISTDGGTQPRWRAEGQELYYVNRDRRLISVPLRTAPDLQVGTATPLSLSMVQEYDVTADGKRFIATTAWNEEPAAVTFVLNWAEVLRK